MKKIKLILIFFTFIPLFLLTDSTAANSEKESQEWSGQILSRLLEDIGDELDNQTQKLTSSIFELLTDIKLYEYNYDDMSIGLKIERKVFNNHNIVNSYTVIDNFKIPINLPIPIISNSISGGNGIFKFHLGSTLSVNSMNIRQVYPKDINNLDPVVDSEQINEYISHLKDDLSFTENTKDPYRILENDLTEEDKAIKQDIEKLLGWSSENVLRRARYSNILNLLTQPFKLPLTNNALDKMEVGEISSYKLGGSIQLGATVGFSSIDYIGSGNILAGVGVTTYLHGDFKISILKESETQVHLKVNKSATKGRAANLGVGLSDFVLFGGVVVMDTEIGEIKETIIPFNLSVNKSLAKSFDVGYRYDLTNPKAKKAYFKAVYGKLKDSEDLSNVKDGVIKVYTRDQVTRTTSRNHSIRLSVLFQRGHLTSASSSAATITLNGTEHHIFQAINSNSVGYSTLWGASEARSYRFFTTIDNEVLNSDREKGISLKVEASFKDRNTSSKEMRKYITEVVTMTGIDDFLIKFPNFDPNIRCEKYQLQITRKSKCTAKRKRASYGKSQFFYRLIFNRKQIEKFTNYAPEKMWEVIEVAYGIKKDAWASAGRRLGRSFLNGYASILNLPLAIFDLHINTGSKLKSARKFIKNWRSLKSIKDPKELTKKISKLFNTTRYSYQFLKVIKMTLENEDISFFMTAQAKKLFGTISRSGKVSEDLDTVTTRADNLINFDRMGPQANFNPNAYVEGLSVNKKSNNEIEIKFNLPDRPKFVFLRMDKTSSWSAFKNLGKFILNNKNGKYVKGENTITIKLDGKDEISKEVAEKIFASKYVSFLIAITYDESSWGRVSSKRIRIKKIDDDRNINNNRKITETTKI
jgi:hypothetical protein